VADAEWTPADVAASHVVLAEISVTGLEVAADIGVYAHERGRPQPLVVDVVVRLPAPASDTLDASLDYQRIAEYAHALARERICLIETFARRLAERCLDHPVAQAVEVRVAKPGALRGGLAGTRILLSRAPR
jgi:dihydroneopterin aldolase